MFVFAQTKTGHKIDCIPTHQNRKVLDIDDIIIQLLSIYVAKETNFSKTGASTTLYTEGDTKVATKLLNKALAMLNVTSVDEDKFILIEQAMHTQLTKFAKAILKNYKETYENIKQKLATSACITREELKLIIKQTVSITPKELFLEFKKMIEALLRSAQAGYVYLNTEEDDKNATEQIIDN